MKNRKATGGTNMAAEDLDKKNQRYTYQSKVNDEAEEKKKGGAVKKMVKMSGKDAMHHAGRKPRKNGGRTGADKNPFSSARHGTPPKGHATETLSD